MKLISAIIIAVSLITWPIMAFALALLYTLLIKWFTRSEKTATESLYALTEVIKQFEMKRPGLFYFIILLYCLLIIAVVCWGIYEFILVLGNK
jgi:phosphate/sulfate permease